MALLMADQYWSGWKPRLFYDFKLAPQERIATLQQMTKTTQYSQSAEPVWTVCKCVSDLDTSTVSTVFRVNVQH